MAIGPKETIPMIETDVQIEEDGIHLETQTLNAENSCRRCKRFSLFPKKNSLDTLTCCNLSYVFETDPIDKQLPHGIQKLKPIFELLKGDTPEITFSSEISTNATSTATTLTTKTSATTQRTTASLISETPSNSSNATSAPANTPNATGSTNPAPVTTIAEASQTTPEESANANTLYASLPSVFQTPSVVSPTKMGCKLTCAFFKRPTCTPNHLEQERLQAKLRRYGFTMAPQLLQNQFYLSNQLQYPDYNDFTSAPQKLQNQLYILESSNMMQNLPNFHLLQKKVFQTSNKGHKIGKIYDVELSDLDQNQNDQSNFKRVQNNYFQNYNGEETTKMTENFAVLNVAQNRRFLLNSNQFQENDFPNYNRMSQSHQIDDFELLSPSQNQRYLLNSERYPVKGIEQDFNIGNNNYMIESSELPQAASQQFQNWPVNSRDNVFSPRKYKLQSGDKIPNYVLNRPWFRGNPVTLVAPLLQSNVNKMYNEFQPFLPTNQNSHSSKASNVQNYQPLSYWQDSNLPPRLDKTGKILVNSAQERQYLTEYQLTQNSLDNISGSSHAINLNALPGNRPTENLMPVWSIKNLQSNTERPSTGTVVNNFTELSKPEDRSLIFNQTVPSTSFCRGEQSDKISVHTMLSSTPFTSCFLNTFTPEASVKASNFEAELHKKISDIIRHCITLATAEHRSKPLEEITTKPTFPMADNESSILTMSQNLNIGYKLTNGPGSTTQTPCVPTLCPNATESSSYTYDAETPQGNSVQDSVLPTCICKCDDIPKVQSTLIPNPSKIAFNPAYFITPTTEVASSNVDVTFRPISSTAVPENSVFWTTKVAPSSIDVTSQATPLIEFPDNNAFSSSKAVPSSFGATPSILRTSISNDTSSTEVVYHPGNFSPTLISLSSFSTTALPTKAIPLISSMYSTTPATDIDMSSTNLTRPTHGVTLNMRHPHQGPITRIIDCASPSYVPLPPANLAPGISSLRPPLPRVSYQSVYNTLLPVIFEVASDPTTSTDHAKMYSGLDHYDKNAQFLRCYPIQDHQNYYIPQSNRTHSAQELLFTGKSTSKAAATPDAYSWPGFVSSEGPGTVSPVHNFARNGAYPQQEFLFRGTDIHEATSSPEVYLWPGLVASEIPKELSFEQKFPNYRPLPQEDFLLKSKGKQPDLQATLSPREYPWPGLLANENFPLQTPETSSQSYETRPIKFENIEEPASLVFQPVYSRDHISSIQASPDLFQNSPPLFRLNAHDTKRSSQFFPSSCRGPDCRLPQIEHMNPKSISLYEATTATNLLNSQNAQNFRDQASLYQDVFYSKMRTLSNSIPPQHFTFNKQNLEYYGTYNKESNVAQKPAIGGFSRFNRNSRDNLFNFTEPNQRFVGFTQQTANPKIAGGSTYGTQNHAVLGQNLMHSLHQTANTLKDFLARQNFTQMGVFGSVLKNDETLSLKKQNNLGLLAASENSTHFKGTTQVSNSAETSEKLNFIDFARKLLFGNFKATSATVSQTLRTEPSIYSPAYAEFLQPPREPIIFNPNFQNSKIIRVPSSLNPKKSQNQFVQLLSQIPAENHTGTLSNRISDPIDKIKTVSSWEPNVKYGGYYNLMSFKDEDNNTENRRKNSKRCIRSTHDTKKENQSAKRAIFADENERKLFSILKASRNGNLFSNKFRYPQMYDITQNCKEPNILQSNRSNLRSPNQSNVTFYHQPTTPSKHVNLKATGGLSQVFDKKIFSLLKKSNSLQSVKKEKVQETPKIKDNLKFSKPGEGVFQSASNPEPKNFLKNKPTKKRLVFNLSKTTTHLTKFKAEQNLKLPFQVHQKDDQNFWDSLKPVTPFIMKPKCVASLKNSESTRFFRESILNAPHLTFKETKRDDLGDTKLLVQKYRSRFSPSDIEFSKSSVFPRQIKDNFKTTTWQPEQNNWYHTKKSDRSWPSKLDNSLDPFGKSELKTVVTPLGNRAKMTESASVLEFKVVLMPEETGNEVSSDKCIPPETGWEVSAGSTMKLEAPSKKIGNNRLAHMDAVGAHTVTLPKTEYEKQPIRSTLKPEKWSESPVNPEIASDKMGNTKQTARSTFKPGSESPTKPETASNETGNKELDHCSDRTIPLTSSFIKGPQRMVPVETGNETQSDELNYKTTETSLNRFGNERFLNGSTFFETTTISSIEKVTKSIDVYLQRNRSLESIFSRNRPLEVDFNSKSESCRQFDMDKTQKCDNHDRNWFFNPIIRGFNRIRRKFSHSQDSERFFDQIKRIDDSFKVGSFEKFMNESNRQINDAIQRSNKTLKGSCDLQQDK